MVAGAVHRLHLGGGDGGMSRFGGSGDGGGGVGAKQW